jgi:nitrogen fixation NifU-like protein
MSSELRELYQQVILDHGRKPRNFGPLPDANHEAEGFNPLCGDRIHVFVHAEGDRLGGVRFTGSGCTICTASASMMASSVQGKTRAEAEAMFRGFHDLVTGESEPGDVQGALGKLAVFGGVREFPIRVKCATLPWHTLRAALENRQEPVTTE